ncbi:MULTISPECIES: putative phage tail assembly chaperone [Serratia]|uniref:Protein of uncharacterized function (DUF2765) n=1 Tax=Serratia quinivorans TaxID=137545 RepID=A0A380A9H3_9GAMM|nr:MULTISPECIES: putative phage tail assembly chaperone [Serratia]RYM62602.1 hypothetical protein BSR03_09360 [Serratia proteamaculans]CAI1862246.1 Protein of uncharacterised function (DUF2765) [Serratia quinivorans]SUI76748.1 Protein of uncharacterised function (DUF2765) [Serratia quinivorans]
MSDQVIIILTVAGVDMAFQPTITAYNKMVNETSMDNKVAPATNYLRRIVAAESKDALETFLKQPSAGMQIAAKVNERFTPELDIQIKN